MTDNEGEVVRRPGLMVETRGRAGRAAEFVRSGLLDNGYTELPILSANAIAVDTLPPRHKAPFDRILVAQATIEGILLLTSWPGIRGLFSCFEGGRETHAESSRRG